MRETQQSICEWADATFGVPASEASIIERALAEADELVTACTSEPRAATTRIGDEAADVVIVLARLGRALKIDAVGIACEPEERHHDLVALALGVRWALLMASKPQSWNTRLGRRVRVVSALHCLAMVARHVDVVLADAIDSKMAINRSRRWKLDGNGHGQHVEEPEPSLEEKFRARLASMTPEECHAVLQRVRDFIDREPLEAVPRCPSCGDVELPPGWRVCGACFLREGP